MTKSLSFILPLTLFTAFASHAMAANEQYQCKLHNAQFTDGNPSGLVVYEPTVQVGVTRTSELFAGGSYRSGEAILANGRKIVATVSYDDLRNFPAFPGHPEIPVEANPGYGTLTVQMQVYSDGVSDGAHFITYAASKVQGLQKSVTASSQIRTPVAGQAAKYDEFSIECSKQ